MVQITTGEGVCLFCSWHVLLLTYAGYSHFIFKVDQRLAEHTVKRQMQAVNVTSAIYFFREMLKHFTVSFVLAEIVLDSPSNLKK